MSIEIVLHNVRTKKKRKEFHGMDKPIMAEEVVSVNTISRTFENGNDAYDWYSAQRPAMGKKKKRKNKKKNNKNA